MKKVIIIGGKGTAVVIAEQIQDAIDRYKMDLEIKGFAFDDPKYSAGINGWPVLCGTREAYPLYKDDAEVYFVFGMYRPDIINERVELRDSYGIPCDRWLTFVHPSSTICKSVNIGSGVVILANCVINPNSVIGNHCMLMSNVFVAHDTVIGESNFIAAHNCIGSGITIGNCNFLGLNSTYRTFVKIGNNNVIGMGSNVLNNIENNTTVVGNPARILNKEIEK